MISQEIRRKFLKFFKEKGHVVVPSSPVVPHDDPTLLFINAGMNQFKDVFLGKSQRDYKRAASSQKCIRVGGKHNDLENVGHTSRHLTFFEMLGNFSFGDYFKKEAISFAWEVSLQVFGYDPSLIWATVFHEDEEAFELWRHYLPEGRIIRMGEKDNFWAMGETGPCGPCSELLYDRGSTFGTARSPAEDISGERYLEFWNLVFMQFNKETSGKREPLPKPCVDTGAGLERVVSLKMGVHSLFETDILRELIAQIETVSKVRYEQNSSEKAPAFRVIADHLRSLSFAIADGVQPSNIERGYVLRKILRRAVRYGRMLGMDKPFLSALLPRLVSLMGDDFPELRSAQERIATTLDTEEENFLRTLKRGGNILTQIIASSHQHSNQISGDDTFKLKDTYGLPLEEILLLAKDAHLTVDTRRFEELEHEAKVRSRTSRKVTDQVAEESLYAKHASKLGPTSFLGYDQLSSQSVILSIIKDQSEVESLQEGEEGILLLSCTPFYAEKGGQVGDQGKISGEEGSFDVLDTQMPFTGMVAHSGFVKEGTLSVGASVVATVDQGRRQKIASNHTATHLLHWALQKILGEHVRQAGSVVEPIRLRFDFSHHKALSSEELLQIEKLVNEKIRENVPVESYELSYDEAQKQREIKQFFGEKYGSTVRVVDIDFSKELCGGTHTQTTGTIGYFRILKESSISSGVRRIEAVTGEEAENLSKESETLLFTLSQLLKTQPGQLKEKIDKLLDDNKQLQSEVNELRRDMLTVEVENLLAQVEQMGGISVLIQHVPLNSKELKECADLLMEKRKSLALLLITTSEGTCSLLARISADLVSKGLRANELIQTVAPLVGGKGGGKADSAQAGGSQPEHVNKALTKAHEWMKETCQKIS